MIKRHPCFDLGLVPFRPMAMAMATVTTRLTHSVAKQKTTTNDLYPPALKSRFKARLQAERSKSLYGGGQDRTESTASTQTRGPSLHELDAFKAHRWTTSPNNFRYESVFSQGRNICGPSFESRNERQCLGESILLVL